ncbi:hypothetical protein HRR83_000216 [Exophiala dermatitidis]|nr:hypothetical protein HRR73_002752 [Exophiala dermatitidis]KAJ4527463.1 hypothetical protein HRR74_000217 [Exophiala dermatitidis]KAJ4607993.1 hypothetical protein HRR83_000216 [Exophiala dermatitidis]KAJ4634287.1 hypothetical protein HRR88_000217 [Exophiala dermatitidis]KAJ4647778.1 hypothetical protein HRR89_000949 [Exophiala dermatitidis]
MPNNTPAGVVLNCGDSPLAIASGVTGFWTTFVAFGVAYYAFYRVVISAPETYAAFCSDVSLFHWQLHNIQKDLEYYERQLSGDHQEAPDHEILMVKGRLHEGFQTYEKATTFQQELAASVGAAVRTNRQFSVTRLRVGFRWWWSQKAQATSLATEIASHRSHLTFRYVTITERVSELTADSSQRHLTTRYIGYLHRHIYQLRQGIKGTSTDSSNSALTLAQSNGRASMPPPGHDHPPRRPISRTPSHVSQG